MYLQASVWFEARSVAPQIYREREGKTSYLSSLLLQIEHPV